MPKLLVIDDEPGVCYSFRRVFAAEGVDVLTARTAAEGLELLRDQSPDVVVLDLQLPDRGGLDVLNQHSEVVQAVEPAAQLVGLEAQDREVNCPVA